MERDNYTHDCTACTFLRQADGYDFYICQQGTLNRTTIIARYGNDAEQYLSGYPSADPVLQFGADIARKMGHLE